MEMTRRDFVKHSLVAGGVLLLSPAPFSKMLHGSQPGYPAYAKLEEEGRLAARVARAYSIFEDCRLCPRQCGANRKKGDLGFCRAPSKLVVYSAHPHFGEELSLVGEKGSGTIFFSNCNLRCVFCQNWSIAHAGEGEAVEDQDLANMMISLQKIGCHNINLVTPTHVMPHILNATRLAYHQGLRIPLVYNTSGYERVEILKLLDGVIDIYLPDMKYTESARAAKYSSGASDYPELTKKAIIEMNRQVGEHMTDHNGVALHGLMIRHLVMPNRVAGTEKFVKWVAEHLSHNTYVNIMSQYHVAYKAFEYPEIARGITVREFMEAMRWAEQYGLKNLDPRSVARRDFYQHRFPNNGGG
ncbi:twin-arginine translocation signal domain-containing protein [Thermodesulfobacteriota bacterium]